MSSAPRTPTSHIDQQEGAHRQVQDTSQSSTSEYWVRGCGEWTNEHSKEAIYDEGKGKGEDRNIHQQSPRRSCPATFYNEKYDADDEQSLEAGDKHGADTLEAGEKMNEKEEGDGRSHVKNSQHGGLCSCSCVAEEHLVSEAEYCRERALVLDCGR